MQYLSGRQGAAASSHTTHTHTYTRTRTNAQAHKSYLDSTDHRTKAFRALQASDAQAAHVIEQRMRKLAKLQVR